MALIDFFGAWISPNGNIYWTNNIYSHLKAIREIGIENELKAISNTIQWTDKEKKYYRQNDLPYIALKIGYIRILAYDNQISIQYGSLKNIYKQLDAIEEVLYNATQYRDNVKNFEYVIEQFEENSIFTSSIKNTLLKLKILANNDDK